MLRRVLDVLAMALVVIAFAGCGKKGVSNAIGNLRPTVEISNAPPQGSTEYYSVRLNWFGYDEDGQVVGFMYAIDPAPDTDTAWVETNTSEANIFFRSPNPDVPIQGIQVSVGYHTFVVKAIDNVGAVSAPAVRSFTSRTVAPASFIVQPLASRSVASTTPSLTILWRGEDVDGVLSQRPIKYKFKIAAGGDIDPSAPTSVPDARLQEYFEADAPTFFSSWDSVPGDTTFKAFEGLTAGTVYYFAVVAFDEAGAYEPRFILGSNVLRFRPSLDRLGPDITVFNEFFLRTQGGGINLRYVRLQFPADSPITFNWVATSPTIGPVITGYRWALDIADIQDETERENDADLAHWSPWSLTETSATIGGFSVGDSSVVHYFYVEARDNIGFISLFPIELTIVKPTFENPLLIVDDLQGTKSEATGFSGSYPMEAEQDSFYYAVGGFPDSIGIKWSNNPSAISVPGMFSEFVFDTLDYHSFYPNEGILLSDLARYRVIAWYTDKNTAGQGAAKFGSPNPRPAIRFINEINQLNTLAVYLRQDGKVWLFGDGIPSAIANGFVTRFRGVTAVLPYTSGEDPREDILQLGNFIYDFLHIRSELNHAGPNTPNRAQNMQSCIPYLPQFKCPAPLPANTMGRTCDPRIGPGAERTAVLWGDLPQLTIRAYRGREGILPLQRSIDQTWVVTQPNFVTEGQGTGAFPVLDTLYLCAAINHDPNRTRRPASDGFPNALYYHGSGHGEVVWFGFQMHLFEYDQARAAAKIVLRNLGVQPAASGQPRGAYPFVSSRAGPRILADGAMLDPRKVSR